MKSAFSSAWKASKQPRKQRKYRFNAPAHVQQKFVSVNLTKELRKEMGTRNISARVGDKVKVLRGTFKGKSGLVERVDRKKIKLYINGVEMTKKDGSKVLYPVHPSNVQMEVLDKKDKRRFNKEKKTAKKSPSETPAQKKAAPAKKTGAKQ